MRKVQERLAREQGFTLIELLVVIVIIGILIAIAVPSYLGFTDRANQKAADADVRSAIPSAEALYADTGSYQKLDGNIPSLAGYDQGIKVDTAKVEGDSRTYCLAKTVGNKEAHATRGFAPIQSGNVIEGGGCA